MTKKMMMKDVVRVGLVELHVAPRAGASAERFAAVAKAAQDDAAGRLRTVLRVLRHVATEALDVIVFPGWTFAGHDVPKSVLAACGERVVVVESMGAPGRAGREKLGRYPWITRVVWDGVVVAEARQLLATAAEATDETAARLASELEGLRAFEHGKLGRTALLVCGEPNVVREHAPPSFDTILNPAHTPSRLPAMQRKRARLAATGTLFTTANTHDGWAPREGRAQPASRRAAEWFRRGVRGAQPEATAIVPGATLGVVELPS